ncbi:S66 peptidase family protein [Brevibacillus sp. TJ4]|uniref:S66 peptidase family protein n=1 Tax=Brevibacillus sp. TJ4 TaxID=3234853 RepID=UPI0037D598A6
MNKGKALRAGDTVGLIAPSSPPKKLDVVPKAVAAVEALGFHVKLGETCMQNYGGYLAGTPEQRAAELNAMFADDEIDGILCLRGGYGAPQILPLLDYDCIAENPKLFVGYSDITALHTAFGQCADLATLHGPMAASELADGLEDWSMQVLKRALMIPEPLGVLHNPPEEEIVSLYGGKASGPIVGGNLSLVAALMGTPYELDTRGKLLFLEDIDEEPYRVDRMLTQMALGGLFDECTGVILGTWTGCEPKKGEGFTVLDVFENIVLPYRKPTILNIQIGHSPVNMALPLGVWASLDATNCQLTIEESVTI